MDYLRRGACGAGFAPELRRQRKAAGMTHERLAEAAGVHQTIVTRYENARRYPSLGMAVKLAAALSNDETDRCRLVLSAGFLPPGYEVVKLRRVKGAGMVDVG